MGMVVYIGLFHPVLHVLFTRSVKVKGGDTVLFHNAGSCLVIFYRISHIAALEPGGMGVVFRQTNCLAIFSSG